VQSYRLVRVHRACVPLRRFRVVARCRPEVALRPATSHEDHAALQSVVSAELPACSGSPGPSRRSRFPCRPQGFRCRTVTRRLSSPGSSSRTLPFLSRVSRATPAPHLPMRSASHGVSFPFATSTDGVHHTRGSHAPLCSALGVSHALDGFLLRRLCGFVSPRSHVRDSLSKGFPLRAVVRAFARRCPLAG